MNVFGTIALCPCCIREPDGCCHDSPAAGNNGAKRKGGDTGVSAGFHHLVSCRPVLGPGGDVSFFFFSSPCMYRMTAPQLEPSGRPSRTRGSRPPRSPWMSTIPLLQFSASGHSRRTAPSAVTRPGTTPESQHGGFSMRSPCSSCTKPAPGPTWRTTTQRARGSPARLSPSTFSGPYARGVRIWSATSMPRPCTPPVRSPGLAQGRARGTLFTSAGSPPASPPDGQRRPPPPTPARRGPAGLPRGARLHPHSCGRRPHTCQGQSPHRFGLGLRGP